jgi:predicted TIM-barrel fold metal-dependent hydrolase
MNRRNFLRLAALAASASPLLINASEGEASTSAEPIIDIHQHTHYHGRTDAQLIAHQKAMGATTTILLPAGRYYGLDAECGGNDTVAALAKELPGEYVFFANELPYLKETREVIASWLKRGGMGIGEQKFRVLADSHYLELIAGIAAEFQVPILLHFYDPDYNMELQRFHKILEKFPKVNFIGHAQTWWGHIDKKHNPAVTYPTGKVTPGGITDRLLSDYPNMFGDLSAHSGLNALLRDVEHTTAFFERHQDKLMFGSDCADAAGTGRECDGAQIIAAVRRLSPSKAVERKLLYGNAKRVMKV